MSLPATTGEMPDQLSAGSSTAVARSAFSAVQRAGEEGVQPDDEGQRASSTTQIVCSYGETFRESGCFSENSAHALGAEEFASPSPVRSDAPPLRRSAAPASVSAIGW